MKEDSLDNLYELIKNELLKQSEDPKIDCLIKIEDLRLKLINLMNQYTEDNLNNISNSKFKRLSDLFNRTLITIDYILEDEDN